MLFVILSVELADPPKEKIVGDLFVERECAQGRERRRIHRRSDVPEQPQVVDAKVDAEKLVDNVKRAGLFQASLGTVVCESVEADLKNAVGFFLAIGLFLLRL